MAARVTKTKTNLRLCIYLVGIAAVSCTLLIWNMRHFHLDASYSSRNGIKASVVMKDLECPKVTLSQKLLPLTMLVSFPGSGNTWTRHLLEMMTGIATGSDDVDKLLDEGGFVGERKKDGSVIVVKTHGLYEPESDLPLPGIKRAILLVRNPYRAILADFHRNHTHSHTGTVPLNVFIKNWNSYFEFWTPYWYKLNRSWITKMPALLVMFYEDMEQDLPHELSRLNSFLVADSIQSSIPCAARKQEGNYHRKEHLDVPLQFYFDSDQRLFLNGDIDRLHRLLKRYNHTDFDVRTYKIGD